jgi:hypothetical protein
MTIVPSKYARIENDLYQTEPYPTHALNRVFPVKKMKVWEAAAGNHLMADVLRELGAIVTTSDVKVYSRRHDMIFNFLQPRPPLKIKRPPRNLITNPPYGVQNEDAEIFAERALDRCDGFIALLLTAGFDSGSTRTHLFRDNPRFLAKIVLVDRISWTLDGKTGTGDHAWYCWRPKSEKQKPPVIYYEGRS